MGDVKKNKNLSDEITEKMLDANEKGRYIL